MRLISQSFCSAALSIVGCGNGEILTKSIRYCGAYCSSGSAYPVPKGHSRDSSGNTYVWERLWLTLLAEMDGLELAKAPYPKEIRFFVCSFLAENFHFSLGFLPPPSSSDLDSWIGDFKPLDLDLQCLRVDLVPGGAVLVHSIVRRRSPRHPLPRLHFSGWNFPRVAFLLTPTPDVVGRFSLPLLLGRLLAHFLGSTGIVQMTLAVRYRKEGAIACANLSQMPPSPLILLPLRF
ncbi:uncharacterized protein LOC109826729 [Asparagus officinalis]|uniref:uncharacterized protein LOC109826729 n=1 Tax=Asparagus officinalis TaxID=4686 RepID=UPI00098E77F9|nr:uncharacterized protein LOC109826729 [Asparagus officinalis]